MLPDEVRLTKFGKFLRSTSLDELPELFNILKGDMSIIGPRPLLVENVPSIMQSQKRRHEVRSGTQRACFRQMEEMQSAGSKNSNTMWVCGSCDIFG